MSWRQSLCFFAGTGAVVFAIAVVFAYFGLWMVLPFAGLEMLALGACLYQVASNGQRREVLLVTPELVRVEKGRLRRTESRGGPESNEEFSRHWVRLRRTRSAAGCTRLWICGSGKNIEIGEFLAEPEKKVLAERIRALIAHRTDESGTLLAR